MKEINRKILLYAEKKGFFGGIAKKFVAELTVKNSALVINAINRNIERELRSAYEKWQNEHKTISIHTGRNFVDEYNRQVHQTIAIPQKPEDKEYLTAVAENIFDGELFGGYKVWGFRILENGEKIMDVGVVKIEKDIKISRPIERQ